MRKRLVLLICLVFVISISISYILSTFVFEMDSNSLSYSSDSSSNSSNDVSVSNYTIYLLIILFLILVYLVYHLFYVELAPFFKIKNMKKREDPAEVVEYLFDEIKKYEKKNPSKTKILIDRLNHFYDYLPEDEKKDALNSVHGLKKYIN